MIKYDLKCKFDHVFEGWFPSSDGFEQQTKDELIECPVCGNSQINRALMAPAVKRTKNKNSSKSKYVKVQEADLYSKLRTLRNQVEKNTEDVDTRAEDHLYDALRYGIMTRPRFSIFDYDPAGKPTHNMPVADATFGY